MEQSKPVVMAHELPLVTVSNDVLKYDIVLNCESTKVSVQCPVRAPSVHGVVLYVRVKSCSPVGCAEQDCKDAACHTSYK